MSLAEIFLRIGGGLGGWIICFAHALVIAVVGRSHCDPRNEDLWSGTLFLALLAGGSLLAVGLGLRWRASLKWFAVATAALAVFAVIGVIPGIMSTTIAGGSLCAIAESIPDGINLADHPATTLQRAWPVVQLVVLGFALLQAARYWRGPGAEADNHPA